MAHVWPVAAVALLEILAPPFAAWGQGSWPAHLFLQVLVRNIEVAWEPCLVGGGSKKD